MSLIPVRSLREQAPFSEEENDPLGLDGIDGKDISDRRRRKELSAMVMKLEVCEENVLDG